MVIIILIVTMLTGILMHGLCLNEGLQTLGIMVSIMSSIGLCISIVYLLPITVLIIIFILFIS